MVKKLVAKKELENILLKNIMLFHLIIFPRSDVVT
jgi:hypothetical protein